MISHLFKITIQIVLIYLFSFLPALATDVDEPIDTNRPSFMSSPLVVPQGTLQLENGSLFSGYRGNKWSYALPQNEVRLGLTNSVEFQMYTPQWVLQRMDGTTASYGSDITQLGFKAHIGPNSKRYNIAFIGSLTLPTGSSAVSGSGVQPSFQVPWTVAIGKRNWTLGGMQTISIVNSGRSVQWQPDILLARGLSPKSYMFIEYGGTFTQAQFPINLIHFGGVYKLTHNTQVDTQFGFGLNKAAQSAFVGIGYSFRFNGLYGK